MSATKAMVLRLTALLLAGAMLPQARAVDSEKVDLALILAVDCSGSVNAHEFKLQLDGIARAFRDPDIAAAATAGPHQRIVVSMMLWADPDDRKLTTDWHMIDSAADADAFAATVEAFNIRIGGGTGIGVALGYGITLLETAPYIATRKVIDVSGDGHESWELREPKFMLPQARAMRAKSGVTVNGLAIANDEPQLAAYYRDHVIGGDGSFVIEAKSYENFADAMRIKLLRELQPNIATLDQARGRMAAK